MISLELAQALRDAGMKWKPQFNDFYFYKESSVINTLQGGRVDGLFCHRIYTRRVPNLGNTGTIPPFGVDMVRGAK